jgi:hypothetical protein
MIPLWIYGAGGAGLLLAGALGGWTVRDWKADSDALETEQKTFEQYTALTEALADQSLQYELIAQGIRASERTDRETIREIYRNVQVPTECAAPAAVVSVLDAAVRDANAAATGQPVSVVSPATKATSPAD